jgi:hypothetical protein
MASIKMAKASVKEIDDAIKLANLTDAVCNCRPHEYPEFPFESDDVLPESFDVDNAKDLRKFYDRVSKLSNGLMRVAFGYGVLVYNVCDPTKDVLELKPEVMSFDEEDMKLLKEYIAADNDQCELAKQCVECPDGPGYRVLNIHFENMCEKRDKYARLLCSRIAQTFVAEQGPQVNPVGTAGEAATAVLSTGQQVTPPPVSRNGGGLRSSKVREF